MKKLGPAFIFALIASVCMHTLHAKEYTLTSPDQKIVLSVSVGETITCTIQDLPGGEFDFPLRAEL